MSDKPTHRYTVCFLFDPTGQTVLLQTKNRTSFKNRLNGVGGKFEPGETGPECAVREIREETGIELSANDLVHVATTVLNTDCAVQDDAFCELHFFAGVIDPRDVNPPEGATEPVRFYDTQTLRNLGVNHPSLAGDGDVAYVINLSHKTLCVANRFRKLEPDAGAPDLIGTALVHLGKHLSLTQKIYELSDGSRKVYDVVTRRPDCEPIQARETPDGVSILLFDASRDFVLLEREFRLGVNAFVYNLPMGLVDPGESAVDAIRRELREETGIDGVHFSVRKPVLPVAYTAPGMSDQTEQLFIGWVEDDHHDPHPVPTPKKPSPSETIQSTWLDRASVATILYDHDATAFSAKTQALLHGWLCGADYTRP